MALCVFGISLLIVVGCGGPPGAGGSVFATPYDPEFNLQHFAVLTAETVLQPVLSDASAAQFCPVTSVRFSRLPNIEDKAGVSMRRWFVQGLCIDPNPLGAMVRKIWTMEVAYENDRFVPVAVTLEGSEVFRLPEYTSATRVEGTTAP